MNIRKPEDIKIAINNFKNNNPIGYDEPSEELISTICTYNNYVDQFSTLQLCNNLKKEQNIIPIEFLYNSEFDVERYRGLINARFDFK